MKYKILRPISISRINQIINPGDIVELTDEEVKGINPEYIEKVEEPLATPKKVVKKKKSKKK